MKQICIFLCLCFLASKAASINAIALIVDNEPITVYEINEAEKKLKTTRENAINFLINDRIERAQIKKMGTTLSEFELETEIKKIFDEDELKAELRAKKQSYEDFKEDFKSQLEKRRLYELVASGAKIDYSEEAARSFYERNLDEFLLFTSITVSVYNSSKLSSLENLRSTNKKDPSIKEKTAKLSLDNSDPRLLVFLSRLAKNEYSPILEDEKGFVMYRLRDKSLPQPLAYEDVREEVGSVYINQQRQDHIKDFFDKAYSKANITRLR
ncbi:peptidylprolyl isomerase [Campylobacter troglodytis]|uniref:peptidylprolyl isomerase n=1 Tax=Campylobacter troglodytis TaxID=654363 RepID=UPI0011580751|nr:peptidylprolyl isomerase [Campylobacter troglodytis]TQR54454.1 hypothetical protein DMC01_10185 [Campylobacter troglodytis]